PTKKSYEVGETAEVLVQAPFSPAHGVWLLKREGIVTTTPIVLDGGAATIKVPIEEWMIPGVSLSVFLNGEADRVDDNGKPDPKMPKRPAFAMGGLALEVPATLRKLTVAVTPLAARTEPGAETAVDVQVTDMKGAPVGGAEVALVVVD